MSDKADKLEKAIWPDSYKALQAEVDRLKKELEKAKEAYNWAEATGTALEVDVRKYKALCREACDEGIRFIGLCTSVKRRGANRRAIARLTEIQGEVK